MHINRIGFRNTRYCHIMFAMGSMIKYVKVNNIEYLNKQVNKLYLKRGLKITYIHDNSEFKPLR